MGLQIKPCGDRGGPEQVIVGSHVVLLDLNVGDVRLRGVSQLGFGSGSSLGVGFVLFHGSGSGQGPLQG